MADNQRVAQLLDEILDSERAAEDVCAAYPDLLPEVQRRLREIYAVEAGLEVLLPTPVPEQRDLQVHVNDALADTGFSGQTSRAESEQPPLGLPISETAAFDTDFRSFERLLLEMPGQRSLDVLLRLIVQRLAERPHVALARIWLLQPGDICPTCPMREVCPDQAACLHLAASAGRSLQDQREWSRLDGVFRRMPLGVRKVGLIAARGEAIQVADLQPDTAFASQRAGPRRFGGLFPRSRGRRGLDVVAHHRRSGRDGHCQRPRLRGDRSSPQAPPERHGRGVWAPVSRGSAT
jgi:hypothetical protein